VSIYDKYLHITNGPWWVEWKDTKEREIVLVESYVPGTKRKIVLEFGGDIRLDLNDEFLEDREFICPVQEPTPPPAP
jgi:hypothetical protein